MTLLTATGGTTPFNGRDDGGVEFGEMWRVLEVKHWWKRVGQGAGQDENRNPSSRGKGNRGGSAQPTAAMTNECHEHDAMTVCVREVACLNSILDVQGHVHAFPVSVQTGNGGEESS